MTTIFYYFTNVEAPLKFAGAPFFLGGIFMLSSFMITLGLLRKKREG